VIVLVVAFALFVGYKRLSSVNKGEPAEDEMSKKVMRQTAALSYYISLYLWLAIMYFSDKLNYEIHTVIGAGILGMAVTFGVCWLVINFRGIRNE
jgi:peptidoglycan/LPS O-acetylase OafA/YrhL